MPRQKLPSETGMARTAASLMERPADRAARLDDPDWRAAYPEATTAARAHEALKAEYPWRPCVPKRGTVDRLFLETPWHRPPGADPLPGQQRPQPHCRAVSLLAQLSQGGLLMQHLSSGSSSPLADGAKPTTIVSSNDQNTSVTRLRIRPLLVLSVAVSMPDRRLTRSERAGP